MNGEHVKRAVANRNVEVLDPNSGIKRQLFAGQEVPPDLVGVYEQTKGEGGGEPGLAEVGGGRTAGEEGAREAEEQRKARVRSHPSAASGAGGAAASGPTGK